MCYNQSRRFLNGASSEMKPLTEDDKYTRKLNEMSELLDFVLSMKIDYYQNRYPGSSRDGIISLVNYEILESKYKEWDAEVPPELQNFFKNRARLRRS